MIHEMQRFITAVHVGSLTKAAKALHISQPALTLSIQRLEKEIGAKFFKNVGHRLVLTADGQHFYEVATRMLALWERTKDSHSRGSLRGNRIYSLGIFDNAALKLSRFFQTNLLHNQYNFEITIDRTNTILRGLISGIFDLGICLIPLHAEAPEQVTIVKKIDEKLLPVSAKKWREDIDKIPFILYDRASHTREYIDHTFLQHGIAPKILVESTSPAFIKELALGGCGIALLPENMVAREIKAKQLFVQKMPFTFHRTIGVFLSKDGSIKENDNLVSEIIDSLNS